MQEVIETAQMFLANVAADAWTRWREGNRTDPTMLVADEVTVVICRCTKRTTPPLPSPPTHDAGAGPGGVSAEEFASLLAAVRTGAFKLRDG